MKQNKIPLPLAVVFCGKIKLPDLWEDIWAIKKDLDNQALMISLRQRMAKDP